MTPPEILEIAADLAEGQYTVSKAVSATLAFVSCYPAADRLLAEAVGPTPGVTLCRCGKPAMVAAVIRSAAHQASYEVAA